MLKKYFVVFLQCLILVFFMSCIYPIKQNLFLGIKGFLFSQNVISAQEVVLINYKRAKDNDCFFIVSKKNPCLIADMNNKYIKDVSIIFKESLNDNLKFNVYIEKENEINITKISNLEKKSSEIYNIKINEKIKNLIVVLGKQIGDSFCFDKIIYTEEYKYYFSEVINYNYFGEMKLKHFWKRFCKILILFVILVLVYKLFFVMIKILKKRMSIWKK